MYILAGILLIFIFTTPVLFFLFFMTDDMLFDGLLSEHIKDRAKRWLENKINKE